MKRSTLMTHSAILAALGLGLGVAACNPASSVQQQAQQAPAPAAALPLTTAAAPPIVDAPTAEQLPPAPRARVARVANPRDAYAYADQAYAMSNGLGDAPPDYTFDYAGARPWVWRADNDAVRVVEPLPGGDRYYYYKPGQTYPYLVRDPDYTYGYDNGALVVVYDREGRQLPPDYVERRADYAGRYLYRGRDLYVASQQAPHQPVAAANWSDRRVTLATELAAWALLQNQQPDWRAYHDEHQDQEAAYWDQERYRRQAQAARADDMLNDHQAAQRDWQAAQQAQADARNRASSVPGGPGAGQGSGQGAGGIFGQRPGPPAAQAPANVSGGPGSGQGNGQRPGGFLGQRQGPPAAQAPAQAPVQAASQAPYAGPAHQAPGPAQSRPQFTPPQPAGPAGQFQHPGPAPAAQHPHRPAVGGAEQPHQQPPGFGMTQGRPQYATPEQAMAAHRQAQTAAAAPATAAHPQAVVAAPGHPPHPTAEPPAAAPQVHHPAPPATAALAAHPATPPGPQHPALTPAEKDKADAARHHGEHEPHHPGDPAN